MSEAMLSSEKISGQLRTKWAARNILYKDVTDSTNNDARKLALEGAPSGTLAVADRQDAGRGSNGRGWETPAGSNIAMSLVLRPKTEASKIPMLTLVMGLSVAEGIDLALKETGEKEKSERIIRKLLPFVNKNSPDEVCSIKWPNDVVIDHRKVCGILTELHMSPKGEIEDAIIGVGINVNMVDFPEGIKGVAGSLLTQTGKKIDRSLVVARVMERFEENYEKFDRTKDLSLLRQQYESRLINRNRKVMILDPRKAARVADKDEVEQKFQNKEDGYEATGKEASASDETGTCLGITELGALIVEMDSGVRRSVNAGEVSVRGIYGYV